MAVATGLLVGVFLAVALDGIATALHARAQGTPFVQVDRLGGAALLAALGLFVAWAFGAVALHTAGEDGRDIREAVQRSAILAALNEIMPPSGPLLKVLRRVDPRPFVRGPDANVPAPDGAIVDDPEVGLAAQSAVRVLGTACGLGVAGSGWIAGDGLVVTNAHVVAGQEDTTVALEGSEELGAEAVHYSPRDDLAILQVDGLPGEPLELAPRSPRGADGAVAGFPENGPLTLTPARLGRTGTVTSQDSYGRGPVQRSMTPFRADVRSGNSGGPVIDGDGHVVATVFAASAGSGPQTGLGVPNDVVAEALGGPLAPTDTGPCAA